MSTFDALAARLAARFHEGVDQRWPDFDERALEVFAYQFETNPVYRAFAERRGRTPADVGRWQDIPAVPASAFKHLPLVSGEPTRVERVFRTSGTTARAPDHAAPRAGEHRVLSLALYEAAAVPNLAAHLVPDLDRSGPPRLLSLIPDDRERPESSLATMMAFARRHLAAADSAVFGRADDTLDLDGFFAALDRASAEDVPIWLAGTAFAWVHALDEAARRGWRTTLPAGSRLMETGGFKGRTRAVPREELYGSLEATFGIPTSRMVNEYGMTELLSQFYEPALRRPETAPLAARYHVGPPWVRTRVLDPETLEPRAPGEPGLLCHVDLANLGSVAALLTADLGLEVEGGFRVLGRAPGAEPRGCSLALESLLEGSP